MTANRILRRRDRRDSDEGVALVVVVVVMFVGFIVASTIAAAVMLTITANVGNRRTTQAFIAAESGRDALLHQVVAGCASLHLDGSAPDYSANAKVWNPAAGDSAAPTKYSDARLSSSCPGPNTRAIVIESTGRDSGSSPTTIDSAYAWQVTSTTNPGGTMSYFEGQFKTTGSTYVGDLVVRTGNYDCSNAAIIDDELGVVGGANGTVGGNVTLSSGCVVTGNIYAAGTVSSSSQPATIGKATCATPSCDPTQNGDVIANGQISLVSNGLTIFGNVRSRIGVTLSDTGSTNGIVGKQVIAGPLATVSPSVPTSKWTIGGTPPLLNNQPAPTFNPTLSAVFGMTTWIDLSNATSWGAGVTKNLTCPVDPTPAIGSATTRIVIDYTSCGVGTITVGSTAVPHNAVILIPASKKMDVTIAGSLTGPGQLFIVHADQTPADATPICGNGNQKDKFTVNAGWSISVPILIYSPCGLTGTFNSSFSGQIYVNDDTRTVNSNFACAPMSWGTSPDPLSNIACRIRGTGGAAGEVTVSQTLGGLLSQIENPGP